MRGLRLAALALVTLPLLGVERPPGLGDVVEVRHWSYAEFTRVVVELSGPVVPLVKRLPADAAANRPARLYLDLDGVWVGRRYADPIPVGDKLLQGVRVGQNTLKKTRLVIDLKRYSHHRLLVLSSPDRVVVDLYGRAAGGAPTREAGRAPFEFRPVRKVVIDPGHGGDDPGAFGKRVREKDVTLRLSRKLAAALRSRGFQVVLTRHGDRTLSLEERTAFAEGAGGDLFISVHANAARRRGASGIETYYLNEDYERHSVTVAARENGIPMSEVDTLQRTVAQLRVSAVSDHSARLAHLVQKEMVQGVRRRYGAATDLGVKKGPFYVLFLANMPSILVEAGFLTNGREAVRLRDDKYLHILADEIADGVERYRDLAKLRIAGTSGSAP